MWFDPVCPWAWLTSRWLLEVENVRDVRVTWSVMSLALLNEGRHLPPEYQKRMEATWGPVRVIVAAAEAHGDEVVKPLYDAIGGRIHPGRRRDLDGVAFFGPVVTPAPRAEAAGLLWDGCRLVAATPGFYELKRTRTVGPLLD
jgi:hypothetical protein